MGLLDISADQGENLMSMGLGLLSASGPSRQPVSLGQALSAGYQHMQQNQQLQRHNKREDLQMQLAQDRFGMEKEYKTLQEQQMRMQMLQQQEERKLQAGFLGLVGGQVGNQMGGQPESQPMPLPQLGEAQGTGKYQLDVSTPEAQANLSKQLDYLAKNDPETHKQVLSALVKQGAIDQPMQRVPQQPQNWGNMAQLSAMGQLLGVKGASGMMELAKFNRPDWQQIDAGGRIQFVNKNGGQMPTIQKSMSPDAIASNEVARGNLDVARQNANKPTYHDGALVSPDGSITKTPMYAPPKGSPEANAMASAKLVPLLEEAERLLPSSTGSYAGTAADAAAGAVGISTKGAQSAAQLKALEGAIMLAQPRMEGPQSDKDVALYRQMAAQIGDSTVPVGTRKAAVEGIKKLHQQYSGGAPKSTMSGGGWSATIVK